MFDSHCHLNDEKLFPRWQEIIKDFENIGGTWLINVGTGPEDNDAVCCLVKEAKQLFPNMKINAAIGLHPCETRIDTDIWEGTASLRETHQKHTDVVVAIWECGIDLHYPWSTETLQLQQEIFARQCQYALDNKLPVVIHSRDGFQPTIDVLKDFPTGTYYFHCFGYGPKELEHLLTHYKDIYFGFDGNITYPNAHLLRESCLATPLDRLLIETDAPYLTPIPFRGQTNESKYIQHTYEFIANLKWIAISDLETGLFT